MSSRRCFPRLRRRREDVDDLVDLVELDDRAGVVVPFQSDGRARPAARRVANEKHDERIRRPATGRLDDGVDASARVSLQVHVVVGHVGARQRGLASPGRVGIGVAMDGEIIGPVRLVAPEDAHLPGEGDDAGVVVAVEGRLGPWHVGRERSAPDRVVTDGVAHARVDYESRSLLPRRPELPGGVLRDREGLRLVVADLDREAGIQRIRLRGRVVAVAIQAGRVPGARTGRKDVRGHVQLPRARVPERVRPRARTVVQPHPSINPALRTQVQTEDVVGRAGLRPHARPPRAVVPPQLALRFLPRQRRLRPHRRWSLVADVADGRARRRWRRSRPAGCGQRERAHEQQPPGDGQADERTPSPRVVNRGQPLP